MKRNFVRAGALIGAASLSLLVAGPTMAATAPVSQATGQALKATIVGNSAITNVISAVNDGTQPAPGTVTNPSTLPTIVGVLPGMNLASIGVFPQDAVARPDSTSAACAGTAGPGATASVVNAGSPNGCITGSNAASIDLGNLNLGGTLLDPSTALANAIAPLGLSAAADAAIKAAQGNLIPALSTALKPAGVTISGSLGVISSSCTANGNLPSGTQAAAVNRLVSSAIKATIGGQTITLLDLSQNTTPSPAGTEVVLDPAAITQVVINDLTQELTNVIQGQLGPLATLLGGALQQIQDSIIKQATDALKPVLQAVDANLLSANLNRVAFGDGGNSVSATALEVKLLPALGQNGIDLTIGHTTCGPNTKAASVTPPAPGKSPSVPAAKLPKQVNSGQGASENILIGGTAALLAMSGGLGLMAYRRYWMPRG